jgi:agmatine deiminase
MKRLPVRGILLAFLLAAAPCLPESTGTSLLPPLRPVAEFERAERVIVRYPSDLPPAALRELAADVAVTTIVSDARREREARAFYAESGVRLDHCDFIRAVTDSWWTRDYVPWFGATPDRIVAVGFTYDRDRPADEGSARAIADFLDLPLFRLGLVHTGGNFLTDGFGTAFSTDLLRAENPSYDAAGIDRALRAGLGVTRQIVLPDPTGTYIRHINTWAKLLAPDRILLRTVAPGQPGHDAVEEIAWQLSSMESPYGAPYRLFRVRGMGDEPYLNSIVVNDKVLVPIAGSPWDEPALASYREAMPGYRVVGVLGHWLSTDALACRTFVVPDRQMLSIRHVPPGGSGGGGVRIEAAVISYGGFAIDEQGTGVWYAVDRGGYRFVPLRAGASGSGSVRSATLEAAAAGRRLLYYIEARDASGRMERDPFAGRADPHVIEVRQ